LRFALRPAVRAALWLGETAFLVERLLPGRESECLAAIAAGDRFIGHVAETSLAVVHHGMTKTVNTANGFGEMARQESLSCDPNEHLCVDIVWVYEV
jgi:hypothetical protein